MKTPDKPLISLIIPTRERADTLAFTLATALDQTSRDYEVIVSDNASEDDTRTVVERCSDPRVRYFNTGCRLSMCDNYEFALEQAVGEYVIIIGDDDAVMPGALDKLVARMRTALAPVIYMWPLHVYDWPVENQPARVAHLSPTWPQTEVDLKRKAKFVISMGGWKYYELPSPYHCAIPKKILDEIRVRTGRVFHSTQPDVFTAMALPALADRALNIGVTITLNGRSARSNGLGFIAKSALPNIQHFIREYNDYHFHPTLYPGVSGAANMIPDAVLVAMDLYPDFYKGMRFDYDAMWAYICRLRFASHGTVLQKRAEIRKYHGFHPSSFLFFSAIHEISVLRRNFLTRIMPWGEFRDYAPNNIQAFVKALAARSSIVQC
jgi:glycosyltransferase involved in cell wall biosynthesis